MDVFCPLCKKNDTFMLFQAVNPDAPSTDTLAIKQCKNCFIVFTTPAATAEQDKLYFDSYYGEYAAKRPVNSFFIRLFQSERRRTALSRIKSGRILDVGCGDGTFLAGLGDSFEKFAYDSAETARKNIAQRSGIEFFDMADPSCGLNNRPFDIVTFWHSFEHIIDPGHTVAILEKIVRRGGAVFISVPNFNSLQARLFRGKWFHLDPPRHIFHYTKDTLLRLFENRGFKLASLRTLSFEYGVFGWFQSIYNWLGLEYNLFYNLIKGRKRYRLSPKILISYAVYAITAIPVLLISITMSIVEAPMGKGSVINAKFLKT